jgi:hypothetical protein
MRGGQRRSACHSHCGDAGRAARTHAGNLPVVVAARHRSLTPLALSCAAADPLARRREPRLPKAARPLAYMRELLAHTQCRAGTLTRRARQRACTAGAGPGSPAARACGSNRFERARALSFHTAAGRRSPLVALGLVEDVGGDGLDLVIV